MLYAKCFRYSQVPKEGITPQDAIDILETISDAFVVLDRDFTITYVNSQAEKLVGRKRDTLIGKNHWQEYPALAGTPLEREYRRVMAERSRGSFEHYYAPTQNWYHVRVLPATCGGIAIFFRDITEDKTIERERRDLIERLEQSNRDLERFAYAVSHDLQEPLRMVGSFAQLLAKRNEGKLDRDWTSSYTT